jgi:hypothetical protein
MVYDNELRYRVGAEQATYSHYSEEFYDKNGDLRIFTGVYDFDQLLLPEQHWKSIRVMTSPLKVIIAE